MSAGVNRVAQGVSRHSLEEVITGKKRPLYEHGWMDTEEEEERAAAMCNGVVIELRPPQPPQRTQRGQIPRHSGLARPRFGHSLFLTYPLALLMAKARIEQLVSQHETQTPPVSRAMCS